MGMVYIGSLFRLQRLSYRSDVVDELTKLGLNSIGSLNRLRELRLETAWSNSDMFRYCVECLLNCTRLEKLTLIIPHADS